MMNKSGSFFSKWLIYRLFFFELFFFQLITPFLATESSLFSRLLAEKDSRLLTGLCLTDQKGVKVEPGQKKEEAVKPNSDQKAPILRAGEKGFSLSSWDEAFILRWRGYIQADSRWFFASRPKSSSSGFLMRRVRPIWEGVVYKKFDFRIMVDFGGNAAVLQDAYLTWNNHPYLRVQMGQFKSPVGLERLQSATDLAFNERAFPTELLPNRDIGVMIEGRLRKDSIYYAFAIFNGVVNNISTIGYNPSSDIDVAARLYIQPFLYTNYRLLQGLGIGVAGTIGRERTTPSLPLLPRYVTPAQQVFFSYRIGSPPDSDNTVIAHGPRNHFTAQSYYHYRRFAVMSEYALSLQSVYLAERHASLVDHAWQVTTSWVITGEDASYTGVRPRHPFDPSCRRWGALEWVMRVHQLWVDPRSFPYFANPNQSASRASAWAIGLNWYLNDQVKIAVSYSQTAFSKGAPEGRDRPDECVLFTRGQLSF